MSNANGWTISVKKSIARWSTVLTRLSDVYDTKADQMRVSIKRFNTILLIVGLASVVTGLLQLNESSMEYRILLIISTSLSELITGYMTIASYDQKLEVYSRYNEKLKMFLGEISTQTSLPEDFRTPGIDFLKNNTERYQKLLIEKPNILGKDMKYTDLETDRGTVLHRQLPDLSLTQDMVSININTTDL
jgi:hypothetical protein